MPNGVPTAGGAIGADQLGPLDEIEPPGPAPRRRAHHAKRRALRVFDRIGHISVQSPNAGPEVPDERPGARSKHAADLGQTRRRVGPVVHRQRTDDQVERSVGERHRGHVADEERWTALVAVPRTVGVGSGALDHGWIQVETGHVEAVLASQPDRKVARPAAHLEYPCAVRGGCRDIVSDGPEEGAEKEPTHLVVGDGIADEDPARHLSPPCGTVAVSHYGGGPCGRRGRSEQDHECSCLTHYNSSVYPKPGFFTCCLRCCSSRLRCPYRVTPHGLYTAIAVAASNINKAPPARITASVCGPPSTWTDSMRASRARD